MIQELFVSLEAKNKIGCSFMLDNGHLYLFKKIISKTKKTFKIELQSNETGHLFVIDIDNNHDFNVKFH